MRTTSREACGSEEKIACGSMGIGNPNGNAGSNGLDGRGGFDGSDGRKGTVTFTMMR